MDGPPERPMNLSPRDARLESNSTSLAPRGDPTFVLFSQFFPTRRNAGFVMLLPNKMSCIIIDTVVLIPRGH